MRSIIFKLSTLSLVTLSSFALADAGTAPAPTAAPASQQQAAPAQAATNAAAAPAAASNNPANANNTQQIETTVHQYLLKKPEVVVEALQAYQQKQMQSMQDMYKETQKLAPQFANDLFHNAQDPVAGDAKGKVSVVEFTDYQCSHCIEVASIVDKVLKANPTTRVVIKEFPIRGPLSETAARAALAANKQGKYWPFHLALYGIGSAMTEDKIYETAKAVGLNVDKLKKDMDDKAIKDQVAANQKLAVNLKLIGTPAFFIAKSDTATGAPSTAINYIPGILTQEQMQAIIAKSAS